RSRISASETAASATVRTINTTQVTYSLTYEKRGYAPDLATLGPGPDEACNEKTETHACLLDASLACAGTWCTKAGYRYSITSTCKKDASCDDYVVISTPVTASTGTKNYCS